MYIDAACNECNIIHIVIGWLGVYISDVLHMFAVLIVLIFHILYVQIFFYFHNAYPIICFSSEEIIAVRFLSQ